MTCLKAFTICFLSSQHPPLDKRVFDKEALSLSAAGYHIVHLCPGDGESSTVRGIAIHTYVRRQGWRGRFFFLPVLYARAASLDADCYHCNEVDSWLVGVLIGLRKGKLVVFDVHEHYPGMFAERFFPSLLRPLASAAMRLVFRALAAFTDRIVLAKESLTSDFKGSEEKIVLARNYPILTYLAVRNESNPAAPEPVADGMCLVHLGLMNRTRCWPELLDALALAKAKTLRLHLIGTFNDGTRAEFNQRVAALGLEHRVAAEDWMSFAGAYERLLSSHAGLVLLRPGLTNHINALPHKMFDYMMAGLPVVAPSFAEEVSRIVCESDCGLLVNSVDPKEIAQALDRLASDHCLRQRLGQNGRRAVLEKYNWESESARLTRMYNDLMGAAQ
jgi:glycosyltransferase involved in cell wall biosynthesis